MAKKTSKKPTLARGKRQADAYASIYAVAHHVHNTVARHCEYCGRPMSPSDVNDYGSLCESCYMKEYYD